MRIGQFRIQRAHYLARNAVKVLEMESDSTPVLKIVEIKIILAGVGYHPMLLYSNSGLLQQ